VGGQISLHIGKEQAVLIEVQNWILPVEYLVFRKEK